MGGNVVVDVEGCRAELCANAKAGISAAQSSTPADKMRPPRGEPAFVAIMMESFSTAITTILRPRSGLSQSRAYDSAARDCSTHLVSEPPDARRP
jgi:hypothetical protein